ncbi:MAG: NUDIX hydrolase [Oscillospiraceae bacterium]|nr:NUDIX hydrolase [Oscillospiraceae bacterium]
MTLLEKTLSREVIYKGRIITVRKDAVELPNGNRSDREVVEHSGGVCVVPLTKDGFVFLVEQFRYPHGKAILEIPAGKLEGGENPEACGVRELYEETGFRLKEGQKLQSLGQMYPTPAYCAEVIHMYLANGLCELSDLDVQGNKLDADEFLNVVKLPFNEAVDLVLRGEIQDAKTQVALLKTRALGY